MVAVAKTFEFAASHRLFREDWDEHKNFKVFGKCSNPNGHGHNYRLEVLVGGQIDVETGMIIDASLLDAIVDKEILQELDHKNLNKDVDWLQGKPTTLELLIESIWSRLVPAIEQEQPNAHLKRLVLWETSRIYAVREG